MLHDSLWNMEERKATLHESWVKGLKEAAASVLGMHFVRRFDWVSAHSHHLFIDSQVGWSWYVDIILYIDLDPISDVV